MSDWSATTAEEMRQLGERVGEHLKAGDVLILDGPLGAGKTTFTQGLAVGLRVRGPVTSPTFVISRLHPSLGGGPSLLHVDAYRLSSLAEVDDLDLDSDLSTSVLVAEWGAGKVENLASDYLLVSIERSEEETRRVRFEAHGERPRALLAALA